MTKPKGFFTKDDKVHPINEKTKRVVGSSEESHHKSGDDLESFAEEQKAEFDAYKTPTVNGKESKEILLGLDEDGNAVQLELSLERGYFALTGTEFDLNDVFTEEEGEERARERIRNDLEDEPELFNKEFIESHSEVSETDARQFALDDAAAYVDDQDLDSLKEMAKEHDIDFDEPEEKLEGHEDDEDYDEKLEKLNDELESKLRDEVESKRADEIEEMIKKDGLRYYIVEYCGYCRDEDFMKEYGQWLRIDIDSAVEDAISSDGWEHFMGDVQYIGNGKYALWGSSGQIDMHNKFNMKKSELDNNQIGLIKKAWKELHLKKFNEMDAPQRLLMNSVISIFESASDYNEEQIGKLVE